MVAMADFRVRRARDNELGYVRSLDSQLFEPGLTVDEHPTAIWWVAIAPCGHIVAYAGAEMWHAGDESALNMIRCGVAPEARGRGLQRRLITARVRYARDEGIPEVWTYTHWLNHASSNNLIRCGFSMWTPSHWGGRVTDMPQDDVAWLYWRRTP